MTGPLGLSAYWVSMGAVRFPRRDLMPLDACAFRRVVIIMPADEDTAGGSLHA
ncbi:hypothetical protein [Paenarthrobacter nicotinovorans]|uniref:hypothetical protein n=1 Tax=Paenarthrobacter nicotinovorans TaxID=29320 RepID=UPI001643135E|nr:hypothetical protein [Paenarthrobacter nicotinovorans]